MPDLSYYLERKLDCEQDLGMETPTKDFLRSRDGNSIRNSATGKYIHAVYLRIISATKFFQSPAAGIKVQAFTQLSTVILIK